MSQAPLRIVAAVPTYNRPEMLIELLDALEKQTYPVQAVCVIDNGSAAETHEAVLAWAQEHTLPVHYSQLDMNGGAAGGFAAAVEAALSLPADWLWLFDDDTEPDANALELMLSSEAAQQTETVALVPTKKQTDRKIMLLPRGRYNGHVQPIALSEYQQDQVPIDYTSYAGLLVRPAAARQAGLPRKDFYMWFDDVEWTLRLSAQGPCWLLPRASITHKEDIYELYRPGPLGLLRLMAKPIPEEQLWKYLYGCRNQVWLRRQRGFGKKGFAVYMLVTWTRILLFNPHKLQRCQWFWDYSRAGWNGEFLNCTAAEWSQVRDQKDARQQIKKQERPMTDWPQVAIPLHKLPGQTR